MERYRSLNSYLRETFGEKLYKLALDGGFTCPNRDGTLGTGGCSFCSGRGSGDFAESCFDGVTAAVRRAERRVAHKNPGGRYIAYFQSFSSTYAPVARLRALYDAIPHMDRFVHNDYHTRNIMESSGELMLIDLGDSGTGNPLFDLIHSCLVFRLIGTGSGQVHSDDEISFIGITYGELGRFWNKMLTAYCGDAEAASRLTELLMPYAQLAYLTNSMAHPRLPKALHPVYVDKVRSEVLSREAEMVASVDEMLTFLPKG